MPTFTSFAALKRHIEASVAKVLENEVTEVMREVQRDAINEEVYNVYPDPPVVYQRRDAGGGLADPNNMIATVTGTTLRFSNITPPNMAYNGFESSYVVDLPALIEYGDSGAGGSYTYKYSSRPWGPTFLAARPFMERTRTELRANRYHVNALHYGLLKAGFRVK